MAAALPKTLFVIHRLKHTHPLGPHLITIIIIIIIIGLHSVEWSCWFGWQLGFNFHSDPYHCVN